LIGHVKPEAAAPASAGGTPLDTAKLAKIAGYEGEQTGRFTRSRVGREPTWAMRSTAAVINARMGLNTWRQRSSGQRAEDAAIAGDRRDASENRSDAGFESTPQEWPSMLWRFTTT